jgi:hypothetical protein
MLDSFNQFYAKKLDGIESPTVAQCQVATIEALLRTFDVTGEEELLVGKDIFRLMTLIEEQ